MDNLQIEMEMEIEKGMDRSGEGRVFVRMKVVLSTEITVS